MFTKGINFKNFIFKKNNKKDKKNLKFILKKNNEIIKSLSPKYEKNYNKKCIIL